MRLVVQRVSSSEVRAHGRSVGKISKGLFALVGFKKGDSFEKADVLAGKLLKLRVMPDSQGKMNLSPREAGAELLVVSQFTLYADTKGGNRPSFIAAEEPARARELYEYFVGKLKELGVSPQTGSFGEYMEIDAKLDGPVTIILEE